MVRPISGNSKSNLTEITYRVEQSSICDDVSMKLSVLLNIFFHFQHLGFLFDFILIVIRPKSINRFKKK